MKILNHSGRKTSVLRPLARFVASHCKCSVMAHLLLIDTPQYVHMNGHAWKREGGDPGAPSRVSIAFGSNEYPKTTVQAGITTTVSCWEEEFVLVLAHELRHVDTFWSKEGPPHNYEEDAEEFAHGILAEYRNLIHSDYDRRIHRTSPVRARWIPREQRSARQSPIGATSGPNRDRSAGSNLRHGAGRRSVGR